MRVTLTPEERFEVFKDFDPTEYAKEAEEKWGGSEAFAQSLRRTARYTKQDWQRLGAEAGEIVEGLAAEFRAGAPADADRTMDFAERHREHITRWFYDCSYEIHRGLGEMYVADPRFAANYEKVVDGLAQYVRDAIQANAARHGA